MGEARVRAQGAVRPRAGRALRRPLPLTVLLLLVVLVLGACSSGPLAKSHRGPGAGVRAGATFGASSSEHRNIVFVLTDDLSSDLVKYMPHVQALAARGTSFSHYIVSDSLCCPSRSSTFTGDFPHTTGVYTNEAPNGGFAVFHRRHDEGHTFATALRAAGYRTAMVGKYLNGYHPWAWNRSHQARYVPPGWSEWGGVGKGYPGYGYEMNVNGHLVERGHRPQDYVTSVLHHQGSRFVQEALRHRDAFMLELASFAPHSPYTPAPRDIGTFSGVRVPRPPGFNRLPRNPPAWLAKRSPLPRHTLRRLDRVQQRRIESVQAVDRALGDIERQVARAGQLDNTYFVFSSDNGYHLGEKRLREGKLTAYDTDIRVPLVVAGPGVRQGVVRRELVQNIDLAPTFAQMAGTRPDAPTEGRSILPLLRGERPPWRSLALVEHRRPKPSKKDPDYQDRLSGDPPSYEALRGSDFTFVHYHSGQEEYYDLSRDPYETDNRAGSLSPSRRRELVRMLARLRHCRGRGCWEAALGPDAKPRPGHRARGPSPGRGPAPASLKAHR